MMMPPRNLRRHRFGFTLVEVLVTVSVISIVIPVIMQGISIATGLASVTRQRAEVVSLAQSKLEELVISGDWQTGDLSGDFSPQYPNYQWQASVTEWDEIDMMQLLLNVTWTSRGAQREVVLSTLIYVPAEEVTQ
jgi:prepilin-type N-terminal cleavage/methylation domain-containing protein